jgi:hypothetical protein
MLKLNLLPMVLALALSNGQVQAQSNLTEPSLPGCHYGEVIDATTADDAKRRIEAAGYTDVRGLKKSCDNFWHGRATLNGVDTNVLVTPEGRVRPEGD